MITKTITIEVKETNYIYVGASSIIKYKYKENLLNYSPSRDLGFFACDDKNKYQKIIIKMQGMQDKIYFVFDDREVKILSKEEIIIKDIIE